MVFDVKNDACMFGISLDKDSDEVHVLHSLRSVVLSVSEKECLSDIPGNIRLL